MVIEKEGRRDCYICFDLQEGSLKVDLCQLCVGRRYSEQYASAGPRD